MTRIFSRHHRVAALIKRELATVIQQYFPINQHGLISISAVRVSPDLGTAIVFVSRFSTNDEAEELFTSILNQKSNQFRSAIAQALRAKKTPQIIFREDTSISDGSRLTKLMSSLPRSIHE